MPIVLYFSFTLSVFNDNFEKNVILIPSYL